MLGQLGGKIWAVAPSLGAGVTPSPVQVSGTWNTGNGTCNSTVLSRANGRLLPMRPPPKPNSLIWPAANCSESRSHLYLDTSHYYTTILAPKLEVIRAQPHTTPLVSSSKHRTHTITATRLRDPRRVRQQLSNLHQRTGTLVLQVPIPNVVRIKPRYE